MNHFTKNIITKGWLNISALTKGFVLPYFKYQIKRKTGGSSPYVTLSSGYNEENLIKDLKSPKIIEEEEEKIIEVYADWNKKSKHDKKIYAQLIKKKIEAKLLENNIISMKINVNLD